MELKNYDITKMSKEDLALFGIEENIENIILEIENNRCEEIANPEDCSGIAE